MRSTLNRSVSFALLFTLVLTQAAPAHALKPQEAQEGQAREDILTRLVRLVTDAVQPPPAQDASPVTPAAQGKAPLHPSAPSLQPSLAAAGLEGEERRGATARVAQGSRIEAQEGLSLQPPASSLQPSSAAGLEQEAAVVRAAVEAPETAAAAQERVVASPAPLGPLFLSFDLASGWPLLDRLGADAYVVVLNPTQARHQLRLGTPAERLVAVLDETYDKSSYLGVAPKIQRFVRIDPESADWRLQVTNFVWARVAGVGSKGGSDLQRRWPDGRARRIGLAVGCDRNGDAGPLRRGSDAGLDEVKPVPGTEVPGTDLEPALPSFEGGRGKRGV